MATTCATVNAALKRRGYPERLCRSPRGPYYYWTGNDTLRHTIVDGVSHLGAFSVEDIIDDLHRKRESADETRRTAMTTWERQGWKSAEAYTECLWIRRAFGLGAPTDEEAAELHAEAAYWASLTPEQQRHQRFLNRENFKRQRNRRRGRRGQART